MRCGGSGRELAGRRPEVWPMPDIALPFTGGPSNMAWLTGYDGPAECLAEVPRKLLVKP